MSSSIICDRDRTSQVTAVIERALEKGQTKDCKAQENLSLS